MGAITSVIFDFGNVICSFDKSLFLRRIAGTSARSVRELHGLIYGDPDLLMRYETGRITSDEFFRTVVDRCGITMKQEAFVRAYTDVFTPVEETWSILPRLKPHYRLGLLSNTSEWDYLYGIRPAAVFPLFDAVTVSFEAGVMKPDVLIYRDILEKLETHPGSALYLDDLEANVEGARNAGMEAIHVVPGLSLAEALKEHGVNIQASPVHPAAGEEGVGR